MDCPDNDVLLRFVDGDLGSIDNAVQRHIEECDRCQHDMEAIRAVDESVRQLLRAERLVSVTRDKCPDSMMLAAYLDGTLSTVERDSMERHLSCCNICLDEIVATSDRLDLLSRNPQSVPANLLQNAIALEQPRNPPILSETGTVFDMILRVFDDAVELINSWDWVQLPALAPAVRGRSPLSRQGGIALQKKMGTYQIRLNIDPIKSMQCQVAIQLSEQDGKPSEDVRVSLSSEGYEHGSYLTHAGRAGFDEISPGEYEIVISDRNGVVERIRLKIAG
jgi:anti-sigma factor RsiW